MVSFIKGVIGGIAATLAMSGVMAIGKAMGWMEQPPPKQITAHAEKKVGISPRNQPKPIFAMSWLVSHFGYGTMCGVIFSVIWRRWVRIPGTGLVYGLVVWAISYLGLMPALRLYPAAPHDRRSREIVLVVGHEVYGGTLELVHRLLPLR